MGFTYNSQWNNNYNKIKYNMTFFNDNFNPIPKKDLKAILSESINKKFDIIAEQVNAYIVLYKMQAGLPEDLKKDIDYFLNCIPEEIVDLEDEINNNFALIGDKLYFYARQSFRMIYVYGETHARNILNDSFNSTYNKYEIRFMAC